MTAANEVRRALVGVDFDLKLVSKCSFFIKIFLLFISRQPIELLKNWVFRESKPSLLFTTIFLSLKPGRIHLKRFEKFSKLVLEWLVWVIILTLRVIITLAFIVQKTSLRLCN